MSLIQTQLLKSSSIATAVLLFAGSITPANAHSWVEQVRHIGANGSFVGEPGYSRGWMSRTDPDFVDTTVLYQLPPADRPEGPTILATDNITKFTSDSYTEELPRLTAAPGGLIALRYQENGHVSLPENSQGKPDNRGTIFIYGTDQASDDDKILDIHHVWNTNGTGGDKRGKLIATRNFDDGQCHQTNDGEIAQSRNELYGKQADNLQGTDLWCQVDVLIPEDVAADSVYTMYWVWDWPTLEPETLQASKNGTYPTQGDGVVKPEVYTSAIDIDMTAADDTNIQALFARPGKSAASAFDEEQDPGNRAIKDQLSNMYLVQPSENDAEPANGGDESGTVPSASPDTSVPSVTDAPESAQATVTVTVTKEPTTLYTVVTKTAGSDSAPTASPDTDDSAGDGALGGIIGGHKPKARRGGFGLF